MKKNFLLLPLVFICVNSFSQSDVATARWMNKPVTIDGVNNEWGELNFYDDETQLNFAIANDSNTIYLCFGTTTESGEMKLLRAGMKITLSAKGKNKHEASILFPLPAKKQQPEEMQTAANDETNTGNQHATHNRESFRQNFITNHSVMEVNGFADVNGEIPINDSVIKVAVNWDSSSNLIYEAAIAKKEFFGAGYNEKNTAGDITLSVEINGLSHSEAGGEGKSSSYQGGGTHMHGSGGYNGGGGGRYGGGAGRYGGGQTSAATNTNNISLTAKTSFKQKFVLNNNSAD